MILLTNKIAIRPKKVAVNWKPLAYRESTWQIYVYPSLTRSLSILFLHMLISTTRMHTVSRQFIPLIYGRMRIRVAEDRHQFRRDIRTETSWRRYAPRRRREKEYFLTSNLPSPFTSVKSCPRMLFTSFMFSQAGYPIHTTVLSRASSKQPVIPITRSTNTPYPSTWDTRNVDYVPQKMFWKWLCSRTPLIKLYDHPQNHIGVVV